MPRVLVIDDESDVLLLCRVNLELAGFEVIEASEGRSGMDLAFNARPDAVVLDLMLPGVDGAEILDALVSDESTKDLPIVVLSAKALREDQIKGYRAGASEYVTKPFSPVALAELMTELLAMSAEERRGRREAALQALEKAQRPDGPAG
jgi:two-component system response regulator RpaA